MAATSVAAQATVDNLTTSVQRRINEVGQSVAAVASAALEAINAIEAKNFFVAADENGDLMPVAPAGSGEGE